MSEISKASKFSLEIRVEVAGWDRIPGLRARLVMAANVAWLHLPSNMRTLSSANLLLTSDAVVRRLNRDFRGINERTNVLSFPQFSLHELSKMGKKRLLASMGDIVLGYQYVVAEAKNSRKILLNHTVHLLIHGLLHLFGYDHQSDTEAGKMERLEKRIMKELGLPDPYKPADVPRGKSRKTKTRCAPKRRAK